jgi:hypothetical protein
LARPRRHGSGKLGCYDENPLLQTGQRLQVRHGNAAAVNATTKPEQLASSAVETFIKVSVGAYSCIGEKEPRASARLQAVILQVVDQVTRVTASSFVKSAGVTVLGRMAVS